MQTAPVETVIEAMPSQASPPQGTQGTFGSDTDFSNSSIGDSFNPDFTQKLQQMSFNCDEVPMEPADNTG